MRELPDAHARIRCKVGVARDRSVRPEDLTLADGVGVAAGHKEALGKWIICLRARFFMLSYLKLTPTTLGCFAVRRMSSKVSCSPDAAVGKFPMISGMSDLSATS